MRTGRRWRRFGLPLALGIVLTLVCSEAAAWACSCLPGPGSCGAFRESGPRFVGDVLSSRSVSSEEKLGSITFQVSNTLFEVKVVESFSDQVKVGTVVGVMSGSSDSDCGYFFTIGQRHFIDSYKREGSLWTGMCSLTRLSAWSGVMLQELRLKASKGRLPDLTGTVSQNIPETSDYSKFPAVKGVLVKLKPSGGGPVRETRTDVNGIYNFNELPSGTYEINLGLPRSLRTEGSSVGVHPTRLTIAEHDGESKACHVWFSVVASGIMEGRIVAHDERNIEWLVSLYAVNRKPGRGKLVNAQTARKDRSFYIPDLPEGRYRITYKALGAREVDTGKLITLGEGERRKGIVIQVSKEYLSQVR
jgi:SdrD B-like domain